MARDAHLLAGTAAGQRMMRQLLGRLHPLHSVAPVIGLALVTACSGQTPEHAPPSATSGNARTENPETSRPSHPSPRTPADACANAAPLTLDLNTHVSASGIALSVLNRGTQTVRIASRIQLIQAEAGQGAEQVSLALACDPKGCLSVAPGSELLAPPWFGSTEAERCGALFKPTTPGTYSLAVRGCECPLEQRVSVTWNAP